MAELKDTADQFAKDLINQNIAGLMMAFTPNGMGQAMALQGQWLRSRSPPALPRLTCRLARPKAKTPSSTS